MSEVGSILSNCENLSLPGSINEERIQKKIELGFGSTDARLVKKDPNFRVKEMQNGFIYKQVCKNILQDVTCDELEIINEYVMRQSKFDKNYKVIADFLEISKVNKIIAECRKVSNQAKNFYNTVPNK